MNKTHVYNGIVLRLIFPLPLERGSLVPCAGVTELSVEGLEAVNIDISCRRKFISIAVHEHREDRAGVEEGGDGAALLACGASLEAASCSSLVGRSIHRPTRAEDAPCMRAEVKCEQPRGWTVIVVDGRRREEAMVW